ncbi:hypothetical protein GCM10011416_18460 [Polaribacter pacificus]|uniref:5'-Nucleotidase C-terminal domain-containing protein n=1 Tax=Polaribacter pacificus TaxID=1775173 RepID=A0A917I0U7_9FLAO|nr:5'-nucleotidase [Polaribacter pacificus]GGH00303.1 hypothetical protein GCM10011416_18460 [Polaribacter pacificus]
MQFTIKKTILLVFSFLLLYACSEKKFQVTKITAKTILVDSTTSSKKIIEETIAPYQEKMLEEINTVLSYTPKDLVRTDGGLESSLGNLLADLSYKRANPLFFKQTQKNIDFALFNYGGIRAGITAGNVTNKNAFELMPFENSYVVVELTAEKVKELVAYLIANKTAHPVSKQFRLHLNKKGYTLTINKKSLNSNQTYFVLTTDYLQSGGDQMNFFKDPVNLYILDYKMRHAIMDEFKSQDTLKSMLDGRFKNK